MALSGVREGSPAEKAGLRAGDVHMIRNAGGLATDDAIRSLVVSERKLGVREVVVIEHTHCGMMTFDDEAMRKKLSHQTGHATDIHFGTFTDLRANLLAQVDKIKSHVWLKHLPVHGLIYHVEDGRLEEVV